MYLAACEGGGGSALAAAALDPADSWRRRRFIASSEEQKVFPFFTGQEELEVSSSPLEMLGKLLTSWERVKNWRKLQSGQQTQPPHLLQTCPSRCCSLLCSTPWAQLPGWLLTQPGTRLRLSASLVSAHAIGCSAPKPRPSRGCPAKPAWSRCELLLE